MLSDNVFEKLFEALDIVLLKQLEGKRFVCQNNPPRWMASGLTYNQQGRRELNLEKDLAYLDWFYEHNLLPRAGAGEFVYSDIWIEEDSDGNHNSLQAIGFASEGTLYIAIESGAMRFDWPKKLIQKGRELELNLEHFLRRNQHLTEALARKKDFLSIVAHDLRNPMGQAKASAGIARKMLGEKQPTDEIDTWLDIVERTAGHALDYFDKLYYWSALEHGAISLQKNWFSLANFSENLRRHFQEFLAEKNLRLAMVGPSDQARWAETQLFGDYTLLWQAFANLVHNAIKFSPPATEILLRLQAPEPNSGYWQLSVQDQGKGLPEELLVQFQSSRYERVSSRPGTSGESGSGLGIAIVRQVVEAHGFLWRVESPTGQGACFTIGFPPEVLQQEAGKPAERD